MVEKTTPEFVCSNEARIPARDAAARTCFVDFTRAAKCGLPFLLKHQVEQLGIAGQSGARRATRPLVQPVTIIRPAAISAAMRAAYTVICSGFSVCMINPYESSRRR